jgi:DNA topoisomerase-1
MNLIIVESPTKAKTISKFLNRDYSVESSFGHIRDLPKSDMGIDIANNFQPHYIIPTKAKKVVANLKALAKKADKVILASDEDREGEAIAWHLAEALKLSEDKSERIAFHEITKEAILEALKNPRDLDINLVNAQQARRMLDRLVGYELSPFLWKKVAKGLSAGRVQSVAIRLIVEREKEIKAFLPEEYWTIGASFSDLTGEKTFEAELNKIRGKSFDKLSLKKEEAASLKKILNKSEYHIEKIEKKEIQKNPSAPFTTSTLQQSANRHLGFSAKQTMAVAQKLYEQGFITYMRTDSLNLSKKFLEDCREWLQKELGEKFISPKANIYKNKSKNAQEAHEAIRPTEASRTPENLEGKLDKNQEKLYRLIWQRAIASQMAPAKLAATTIDVLAVDGRDSYSFRSNGQILNFPGYLQIWPEKTKEQELPDLKEEEKLKLTALRSDQHSTNPPSRYSDASLVKDMEKYGIGRPSTYAPTISTIIARNYIERDENKKLKPNEMAFIVNDLLTQHFPKIVNYEFTANMENELDSIAEGKSSWEPVISDFYQDFHDNLEKKYEEIKKSDIIPETTSDEVCDKCGAPMLIKTGRYGKFLACSAFPDCRNIKKLDQAKKTLDPEKEKQLQALQEKHAGKVCDKCGSPMLVKTGKYGPFLACSAYPKCKNIKNIDDGQQEEIICPACKEGHIVKKFSRRGAFYACSNYPKCKNAYWGKPNGEKCPECGSLMLENKDGGSKCSDKDCGYSK